MASVNNIEALREHRGWKRPELAKRMGTTPQQIERLEKGQRKLSQDWIDKAADAFGVTPAAIISNEVALAGARSARTHPSTDDTLEMVGIQNIDQAFGLGGAFTDSPVEIEVLHFPKIWVDSITRSPPELLTWARGRGDSMEPTIRDGDLVLLDRSKRKVDEQDAIWAYTIGDIASIKRLRVKGDRYQILSDNPTVPDDEEPIDFVNVVARVIFVGMRK